MANDIVETEQKIPITANCDVLIAGGGVAEIATALADDFSIFSAPPPE